MTLMPSDPPQHIQQALEVLENGLVTYLDYLGLPAQNILVDVEQRRRIINNLPAIVSDLLSEHRTNAYYISKLIAAVSVGLFDAALSYLWDEVVGNLRKKAAQFDLEYFYDTAVQNPQQRRRFHSEDDLVDLDDWSLIKGCRECGLITDIGYKHLDYVREMRNWASAAHPNQVLITGFQIIEWLETCIRQVLSKPVEGPVVEARRLLRNLREQTITEQEALSIAQSVPNLPPDILTALLRSSFGLFTDPQTTVNTKNNVRHIAGAMWTAASDDTRHDIALRYSNFAINGEADRRSLAEEFLKEVDGLSYLPENDLALKIDEQVIALLRAHRAMNNFYNEVPIARALVTLIPSNGEVPRTINTKYVRAIVLCRMGRPSGISHGASTFYDQMINLFKDRQILEFIKSLNESDISSRFVYPNCATRFCGIASVLTGQTSNQTFSQMLQLIANSSNSLSTITNDSRYRSLASRIR